MRRALPGTRLGCPRTGCTGLGEGLAFAATAQACRFRRGRALGPRAGIYERRRETRIPGPGTGACGLRRGMRIPAPRTGVRALARDLPSESRTGMRGACEGRAQKSRAPGGTRLPGMRDGSRRFRRVRAHGLRAWMYEHRREVRVPGARNRGMRPPARDAHSRSPYGRAGSCTGLASRVSTLRCAALARTRTKKPRAWWRLPGMRRKPGFRPRRGPTSSAHRGCRAAAALPRRARPGRPGLSCAAC